MQGLIVCLSESGELQCCYLGTEPSVFVAPPLDNILKSYDEMQQKLVNVQNEIDSFTQTNRKKAVKYLYFVYYTMIYNYAVYTKLLVQEPVYISCNHYRKFCYIKNQL